jgi:hypothetical protein
MMPLACGLPLLVLGLQMVNQVNQLYCGLEAFNFTRYLHGEEICRFVILDGLFGFCFQFGQDLAKRLNLFFHRFHVVLGFPFRASVPFISSNLTIPVYRRFQHRRITPRNDPAGIEDHLLTGLRISSFAGVL